MNWLFDLIQGNTVAHAILVIGLVAASGLALGNLKFKGIGLGIAGVLFTGIAFGHYNITINETVMDFLREFGLILFVYSIGMQVGPGFVESIKERGLSLNLMALAIVLMGVAITICISYFGHIEMPVAVGLFSGGTTNTPSLAAAQQTLKDIPGLAEGVSKLPGLGYAVAYPFGILGIILTMLLVRLFFAIVPKKEAEAFLEAQKANTPTLENLNIKVTNPNIDNLALQDIPLVDELGIIISRMLHDAELSVPTREAILHQGDTLLAVGPADKLEQLRVILGEKSDHNLKEYPGTVITKRVMITKTKFNGKTVGELDAMYNVVISRVHRAELEMIPSLDFRVQFGDRIRAVGTEEDLKRLSKALGNSLELLNHPQIIPIFIGIILGVLFGSIPVFVPGLSAPVKLGLAGGPLLVSIALSRLGYIGHLNWYLPSAGNMILRELGIVLFLACVGLHSGDKFVETLMNGSGFYWMGCAALITFVPLFVVGIFARKVLKLNYMSLCGVLAGSMTDPPALAFANSIATSNAPSISYAAVYPLVMLLRVLSAQILVLLFTH